MKGAKRLQIWVRLISLLILVSGFYVFLSGKDFSQKVVKSELTETSVAEETSASTTSKTVTDNETETDVARPQVTLDDWELLLVNPFNMVNELNPELGVVGPVYVDSRIVDATMDFLLAAQAIDPNVHLITGYRSVADQAALEEVYVQQEMEAQGIAQEAALEVVRTYLQAPGASDHHTGLAIDMGPVDMVNQADPVVAKKIQLLAANYGFVLRYPKGKEKVTGVPYEDWHYRYVGVESAKYMTQQGLTLEDYIEEIRREN